MEKLIFNAALQKETKHTLEVDDNNEIVATCSETGATLKFPNVSEEEFDKLVEAHQAANVGQKVRKPLFNGELKSAEPEQPAEEVQPS